MSEHSSQDVGARLRQARRARGTSLRQLARELDISASSLSELERGVSSLSLARLQSVASHLGLSVAELLEAPAKIPANEPYEIIRPEDLEHQGITRGHGVNYVLLGNARGHILQPYRITFAAGAGYTTDPISHPGEEFAHVLFGEVVLHLGDEHHRLGTGTAIRFNSDLPHSFANANQHSVAAVVGAGTPPW